MSVTVALTELAARIEEFGPKAYLVSVRPEGRPHVVSVSVVWEADRLVAGAGNRTASNVAENPSVTLTFDGTPYCLLVDGTAEVDDDRLAIIPTGAVLHRVAGVGDDAGPSCVKVLPSVL